MAEAGWCQRQRRQRELPFQQRLQQHPLDHQRQGGIPAGRARIYGQGGTNYSRGKQATTQTIDNVGTQSIELKTGGWGWQFGGGFEFWVKTKIGVFAEVNRVRVEGDGLEGSQGRVEDYFDSVVVGMRFKVGR